MEADRNKQQMRKIIEIFESGDVAAAEGLVADDYVDHQGAKGSEIRGREGFRSVVESAHEFSAPRVRIEDMLTEGSLVAVRLSWHWPEPDPAYERETVDIMRFENGLAVEHWGAPTTP